MLDAIDLHDYAVPVEGDVQVPPPVRTATNDLAARHRPRTPSAEAGEVEFAQDLRAVDDVTDHLADPAALRMPTDARKLRGQPVGGYGALLHGGYEHERLLALSLGPKRRVDRRGRPPHSRDAGPDDVVTTAPTGDPDLRFEHRSRL